MIRNRDYTCKTLVTPSISKINCILSGPLASFLFPFTLSWASLRSLRARSSYKTKKDCIYFVPYAPILTLSPITTILSSGKSIGCEHNL